MDNQGLEPISAEKEAKIRNLVGQLTEHYIKNEISKIKPLLNELKQECCDFTGYAYSSEKVGLAEYELAKIQAGREKAHNSFALDMGNITGWLDSHSPNNIR